MFLNLAVAIGLAIILTATLILAPHAFNRLFGPKCSECGHRPLTCIDCGVLYDPAPGWSLFHCTRCGADYVRSSGQLTPRSRWNGDPYAEHMFRQLEADRRG